MWEIQLGCSPTDWTQSFFSCFFIHKHIILLSTCGGGGVDSDLKDFAAGTFKALYPFLRVILAEEHSHFQGYIGLFFIILGCLSCPKFWLRGRNGPMFLFLRGREL